MARSWNPFAFTPLPVSILASTIYIAVFAVLLVIHHEVPPPPKSPTPSSWPGVDLTRAWHDLQNLSRQHHPYNSRNNLQVRAWLQSRIGEILEGNQANWTTEVATPQKTSKSHSNVVLFDDRLSNFTMPNLEDHRLYVDYFEGDNLMVYVRGASDPVGSFWHNKDSSRADLVLVNAHYDSVSTGYGTTDDGAGVISTLQLISHFTHPNVPQPKHGLVVLINNGEEDGLYGAVAFAQHPLARHCVAFLNLEGAGAGGRATLFRSTDSDITAPYARSEHPFGTVLSADGFKRGLVRSGTDYTVFNEVLGMRGLDVAFMGPRSAYHTARDDIRDSSLASVWHMLSAALATTTGLVGTRWEIGNESEVAGVWFDLLGRGFAVIRLPTVFALCVSLLVVGPVVLLALELLLKKQGKWYPFSLTTYLHGQDDDEPIRLYGLRGFFRVPLSLVPATAVVVALAFLVTKINPYIVYSSPYATWAMMVSGFTAVAWFLLRLGDTLRPSALSRLYTLLWLYLFSWVLLVGATIAADRLEVGGVYFILFYNLCIFAALLISYIDLLALPSKSDYANYVVIGASSSRRPSHDNRTSRPTSSGANEDTEANERTALLSPSDATNGRNSRQTFARYNQQRDEDDAGSISDLYGAEPYENEQVWSARLPRWTWIIQLVLTAPLNLILIGQIGLLLTTALSQTPADGNEVFTIYIAVAALSVLLIAPVTPFLHRIIWQIPTFLFFVAVGTAVYNLVADPFSRESRMKFFFVQRVDLDSGANEAAITGLPGWIQRIASEMPSAASSPNVECGHGIRPWASRNELQTCAWFGLQPNVMKGYAKNVTQPKMKEWISFEGRRVNTTHEDSGNTTSYLLELSGRNTKACRLVFHPTKAQTISHVSVLNACPSSPKNSTTCASSSSISLEKNNQLRLWSRTFDPTFKVVVDVTETRDGGEHARGHISGEAICLWSDVNESGTIPAFDEVLHFAPVWSAVSKHADGLVEGVKSFVLE